MTILFPPGYRKVGLFSPVLCFLLFCRTPNHTDNRRLYLPGAFKCKRHLAALDVQYEMVYQELVLKVSQTERYTHMAQRLGRPTIIIIAIGTNDIFLVQKWDLQEQCC